MEFETLEQLNQVFKEGNFKFPDAFSIAGVIFKKLNSSQFTLEEMLRGKPALFIYSAGKPNKEQVVAAGLQEWIVFVWKFSENLHMTPLVAKPTTKARLFTHDIKESEVDKESQNDNIIGDVVEIKITSLTNSNSLKGRVDTGATLSSLHAEKFKINNNMVEFISPDLSPNVITMPLHDQQSVTSPDGGTEYRPVVELNIKINDKLLNNMLFNLNDRKHMEHPILVGQNILEKGGFLIDPTINETDNIDWEGLLTQLNEDIESSE